MFEIPESLPAELAPLAWLVGSWRGSGYVSYRGPDGRATDRNEFEFEQNAEFAIVGHSALRYRAEVRKLPSPTAFVALETGFWRISRPFTEADSGPGLVAGDGPAFTTAEQVEALRNPAGGFDINVVIAHSDGMAELYVGSVNGPRIDMTTDAVVRPQGSRDYRAGRRMLGLVEGDLLWAWDIAAGDETAVRSHASARLTRV